MENFVKFFDVIINGFKTEFTLYGFTFSFWDVFIWSSLAFTIIYVITSIFDN